MLFPDKILIKTCFTNCKKSWKL